MGGAAAEQRVIAYARQIEAPRRLDRRIVRVLVSLHRLLSLEHVGDPDRIEMSVLADIHPRVRRSRSDRRITDQLAELLRDIDPQPAARRPGAI